MNSQAFLCTIVYLSVLATEAHSQEGGELRCDLHTGMHQVILNTLVLPM